jgi:hypothetical protein
VRVWLLEQGERAMSVHVDELHTTVETEPAQQGAPAATGASPGADEHARQLRELLACLACDRRRTAAEGHDD